MEEQQTQQVEDLDAIAAELEREIDQSISPVSAPILHPTTIESVQEPEPSDEPVKLSKTEECLNTETEIIPQVEEALQAIFPDKWEIQRNEDNYFILIIHFPFIKITNSKNHSHIIKDLFIRLKFDERFLLLTGLEGCRTVLNVEEWKSGYMHSHLPRNIVGNWGLFCLGRSELAVIESEWRMADQVFDIIQFELWMYQIGAYLQWESLGGGPYIRMSTISLSQRQLQVRDSIKETAYIGFLSMAPKFPLQYDNVKNVFTIQYTKFEKFITDLVLSKNSEILKTDTFLFVKKSGDHYITDTSINIPSINREIDEFNTNSSTILFSFKGQDMTLKVGRMDESLHNTENFEEVVHPDITRYIIQQILTYTNRYFIKKYGK